ncbi:putative serine protease K12H4.7 isoform X2 [Apostichopus japonicus]
MNLTGPCILLLFLGLTSSTKLFHHGRPRGGFLGSPKVAYEGELPKDQWITQKLDNFNDADLRTWSQRYFVNDTFYKSGGPVFLMIGGEGPANPIWMVTGTWIDLASKMGALCLMVEHRYYGQSHPTNDLSVDNLQYLSSEQALADLANFQANMTQKMGLTGNKWVSFGGSYSGSLSAWMRLKYPHLISAAVATSAPVQSKLNFKEYFDVVKASLLTSKQSATCVQAVKSATSQLQAALKNATEWKDMEKSFSLCSPLNLSNVLDVANFLESLSGNFAGVVQYNKDNRAFEGAVGTNITLDTLCDIMTDQSVGKEVSRYAKVNSLILKTYQEKCLDCKYQDMISELKEISWTSSAGIGGRQWTYQTCTEFGFFQTSDSTVQPFGEGFPLTFSLQQCLDIYGSKFSQENLEKGISRSNTYYGGYGIQASKVVYPNGSIDPWHFLGITKNATNEQPAVFINGTAHCADMYPASSTDPASLVKAREDIQSYLIAWLS